MGDKALQELADTLRNVFRNEDIIGRIGGDEFCVFAPNLTDKKLVERKASQLNVICRRTYTSEDGNNSVMVSLSIGATICRAEDRCDYKELYAKADSALYESKDAGRNTYRIV